MEIAKAEKPHPDRGEQVDERDSSIRQGRHVGDRHEPTVERIASRLVVRISVPRPARFGNGFMTCHKRTLIAPSRTPRKPADRVETNRRHAVALAGLPRAGELLAL